MVANSVRDARVQEDAVLEFRALVMSKSVFNQARTVEANELHDLAARDGSEFLGWVNLYGEWFIFKSADGRLLRVSNPEIFQWIYRTNSSKVGTMDSASSAYGWVRGQCQIFRDKLPQIFVK